MPMARRMALHLVGALVVLVALAGCVLASEQDGKSWSGRLDGVAVTDSTPALSEPSPGCRPEMEVLLLLSTYSPSAILQDILDSISVDLLHLFRQTKYAKHVNMLWQASPLSALIPSRDVGDWTRIAVSRTSMRRTNTSLARSRGQLLVSFEVQEISAWGAVECHLSMPSVTGGLPENVTCSDPSTALKYRPIPGQELWSEYQELAGGIMGFLAPNSSWQRLLEDVNVTFLPTSRVCGESTPPALPGWIDPRNISSFCTSCGPGAMPTAEPPFSPLWTVVGVVLGSVLVAAVPIIRYCFVRRLQRLRNESSKRSSAKCSILSNSDSAAFLLGTPYPGDDEHDSSPNASPARLTSPVRPLQPHIHGGHDPPGKLERLCMVLGGYLEDLLTRNIINPGQYHKIVGVINTAGMTTGCHHFANVIKDEKDITITLIDFAREIGLEYDCDDSSLESRSPRDSLTKTDEADCADPVDMEKLKKAKYICMKMESHLEKLWTQGIITAHQCAAITDFRGISTKLSSRRGMTSLFKAVKRNGTYEKLIQYAHNDARISMSEYDGDKESGSRPLSLSSESSEQSRRSQPEGSLSAVGLPKDTGMSLPFSRSSVGHAGQNFASRRSTAKPETIQPCQQTASSRPSRRTAKECIAAAQARVPCGPRQGFESICDGEQEQPFLDTGDNPVLY